jgi:hypothetical protein
MASNTLWQQSEMVRKKKFPQWFLKDFGVLTDFVQKGEVQRVGERDYRIPFQTTPGGRTGHYDPQLGDMGRGSSPTGNVMTQSFFSIRHNYEFDQLQIAATESRDVAVQNPFLDCVATGIQEMELQWDKYIHQNGTALLATTIGYSNSSGQSVYTLDNNFGAQLLRRGQFYNIYDSTFTTLKAAGIFWAQQVNTTNPRTVTFNGTIPNAASGDLITFEGVSGASPAGPRGVQYWISNATSGTTGGINRAQESQIISKYADGTNGLSVEAVMALYDRIFLDRGVVPNLMGIAAPAQRAYAYSQMIALQMKLIEGAQMEVFDKLPKLKGKPSFLWGGIPHYVDIFQTQTIVHYMVGSDFGRARLRTPGWFQTPGKSGADGRFVQLMGSSGGPSAGVWFGFTKDEDLYCLDPGHAGLIGNLPLSTYYS